MNLHSCTRLTVLRLPALLLYDWVLSIARELRYIWTPKVAAASVVYFINRYGMLLVGLEALVVTVASVLPVRALFIQSHMAHTRLIEYEVIANTMVLGILLTPV